MRLFFEKEIDLIFLFIPYRLTMTEEEEMV